MAVIRTRLVLSKRVPVSSLLAALLAVAILLLGPAGPASAHDTLTGTSPKDGQQLAKVPQEVTLTFTDTPIELGSEMIVADEDGTDWAAGPVQIVDTKVTQRIKVGAPAGKYKVTWRIVSADSHPIEGTFTFTAGKGLGTSGAQVNQADPLATPSKAAGQSEVPDQSSVPWGIIGMIAVLVVLVVIIGLLARRKLAQGDTDELDDKDE